MNTEEQIKLLKECKDSMLAIYSTARIALEKLSNEENLDGFHTGGILRSARFHSQDAMHKLSHYIESVESQAERNLGD